LFLPNIPESVTIEDSTRDEIYKKFSRMREEEEADHQTYRERKKGKRRRKKWK